MNSQPIYKLRLKILLTFNFVLLLINHLLSELSAFLLDYFHNYETAAVKKDFLAFLN